MFPGMTDWKITVKIELKKFDLISKTIRLEICFAKTVSLEKGG